MSSSKSVQVHVTTSHSGHYCTGGASNGSPGNEPETNSDGIYTGNGICPEGHYCPQGSVQPEPCPKGRHSAIQGVDTAEGCTACSRGRYCDQAGATSDAVEKNCAEG